MSWAFGGAIFAAAIGLKFVYDGWQHHRPIELRQLGVPSWVMVVGGLVCLIPLAIVTYAYYLRCESVLGCW